MSPLKVQKPIIGKRTIVGQAYDEFLKNLNLPIRQWEEEQKKLRGNKF